MLLHILSHIWKSIDSQSERQSRRIWNDGNRSSSTSSSSQENQSASCSSEVEAKTIYHVCNSHEKFIYIERGSERVSGWLPKKREPNCCRWNYNFVQLSVAQNNRNRIAGASHMLQQPAQLGSWHAGVANRFAKRNAHATWLCTSFKMFLPLLGY